MNRAARARIVVNLERLVGAADLREEALRPFDAHEPVRAAVRDERRAFYFFRRAFHREAFQPRARFGVVDAAENAPERRLEGGTEEIEIVENTVAARPADERLDAR